MSKKYTSSNVERTISGLVPGGFYERNALYYYADTLKNNMEYCYPILLKHLPLGGLILDAGSGSGRDTKAFLDLGYRVEAFDASPSLAQLSSDLTGNRTEVMRFEEFTPRLGRYDGIWAFASLLHVGRSFLDNVVHSLAVSLRPGGILIASFKEGDEDSVDDLGRSYTNLTAASAKELFARQAEFADVQITAEHGPAAFGRKADWIYVKAQRTA